MRRLAFVLLMLAAACSSKVDAQGKPLEVGRLRLRTFPMGAKVWIDGDLKVEATPATLILKPGTYQLRMQLEGAEPLERSIKLEAGDNLDRTFDVPKPAASTVVVRADVDGTTVRINGYPRARTPMEPVIVRPGPLDITAMTEDGRARSWRGHLGVAEQKIVDLKFDLGVVSSTTATGQLTLGLSPAGEIYDGEDDRLIGKSPLVGHAMPVGEHHLVLRSLDNKLVKHVRIVIAPGEVAVYRFALGDEDRAP